ncbi:MAG TPA: SAM-dependent methyltransferase, partial [Haliea salexigens]|nr:SAM-dependent methyltransferase [Haliea salexigens]
MAANTVPENDCLQRFHALDTLLHQHRELWQLRPFHYRVLPWSTTHPTLAAALQRLNDVQLTALEAAPLERLQWLRPWLGEASARLAE